ncbi:MAG: 50S ribosomal protein L6 [Candidatus Odinarchaeia archaeon]
MPKAEYIEEKISVPEGVSIELNNKIVKVSGPKGEISKDFSHAELDLVKLNNGIKLSILYPRKKDVALLKTIASHIKNMVNGVTEGYTYKMKIVYSHFPITVKVVDNRVQIENFIGERAMRYADILPGAKVSVKGDDVIIEGIDIQAVSQTAANIQQATKIKNKDPRVFMDGIYVYQKLLGQKILWKLV